MSRWLVLLLLAPDVTPPAGVDAFFPYSAGAEFTYESKDEDPVVYKVLEAKGRRVRIEVSNYMHSGRTVRTYESRAGGFFLMRNDYLDEEAIMDLGSGLPMLAPGLIRGVPRRWTFRGSYQDRQIDFEVVLESAGWERVTVPAGTFRCLRLKSHETLTYPDGPVRSFRSYWYAPGVGMVKLEAARADGEEPDTVYSLKTIDDRR